MLILGPCMALNLNYPGCCNISLSPSCSNNECYCDQTCYSWGDCCSDIANISCHVNWMDVEIFDIKCVS